MKQLIEVFERLDGPVLAVERVPRDEISSYGVIAVEAQRGARRRRLPGPRSRGKAAEGRGPVGSRDHRPLRATPDIFPALAKTKSDRTGEIQLTNGLRELLKTRPIYACEVKASATTPATSSGFSRPWSTSRCGSRISPRNSRPT